MKSGKNLSRRNTQSALQKNTTFNNKQKDINKSYNITQNPQRQFSCRSSISKNPPPLAIGPDAYMFTNQNQVQELQSNQKTPFQYSEKHQKLFTPHEYIHFSSKVNSTKENYLNSLQQLGFESAPFLQEKPLNDIYQKTNNLMGKSYSSKYIGIIDNNMGVLSQRKKMDELEPQQITKKQLNLRTEQARLQSSSRQKQKLIQQQNKLLEQKDELSENQSQMQSQNQMQLPLGKSETPQPDMYDTYIVSKYSLPKHLKTIRKPKDQDIEMHKFKLDQWHSLQIQGITDHKDNLVQYQWQQNAQKAQQMKQNQKNRLQQQQFDMLSSKNSNQNSIKPPKQNNNLMQNSQNSQKNQENSSQFQQQQQSEQENNDNSIQLQENIQQNLSMGPRPRKIKNRKINSNYLHRKPIKGYKETEDGICYAVIEKPQKKDIISYSRLLMQSSQTQQFPNKFQQDQRHYFTNQQKQQQQINLEQQIEYTQNQNLYERYQKLENNRNLLNSYQNYYFQQTNIDPQQIYKENQLQQTPSFQQQ